MRPVASLFKTHDRFVNLVINQGIGIDDEDIFGLNVRVYNFAFGVKKF